MKKMISMSEIVEALKEYRRSHEKEYEKYKKMTDKRMKNISIK